ncbi:hypothetical protein Tco_1400563 [Tanacetum coccineum]
MYTSALHNAIMEAGGKDPAPMLVAGMDACANVKEKWKTYKRLMQGENINKQDVETNLFWHLVNSHQGMGNHLNRTTQAERLARNANPLTLVTTSQQQSVYYPQSKPNYNLLMSSTGSQAATRIKGKEIARAPTPPPESRHEVASDEEETLREKKIKK